MKIKNCLSLLILGTSFFAFGQNFQRVQLQKPAEATYKYAQVEPSIVINPSNTNEIIAGTVMNDYYYSKDSGKTWSSSSLRSIFGVNGDPVLHINKKGRYFYFHLSNPKDGQWIDRIVCDYSDTITGEWTSSATKPNPPKAQDKPWVSECPKTGNLYLTWTEFDFYGSDKWTDSTRILFSKSVNNGESWSEPLVVSTQSGDCLDGNNTVEGAMSAVNSDGEVFVIWTGPYGIRMNRSSDFGETWLNHEMPVIDQVGGWVFKINGLGRSNGLPVTYIDQSNGEFHNRIYVNWVDQFNGRGNPDSWMIYSDDNGETWSERTKVNQDEGANDQFFTWMRIDQSNGNLYFIYYDRRNTEGNATEVVMAWSKDGGKTIKEMVVSKNPFTPDEDVFFGDYLNIDAVNDVVRPIWPRMDDREISLWTMLIDGKKLD
ncbi:exo-alpha-sialidase [Brumimicrobium oceani]|uniref:Glycosyl hydrolase n=1 Tax=Brumimicrobium oceani TaxID=2100725 RepID=A0A2U2XGV3_9FLAO|nr:exo-alpha-sialidase [Brumimicrobium oceani]PWH87029.1 glycosyl hydrolase [Brumimicrobium oceani]